MQCYASKPAFLSITLMTPTSCLCLQLLRLCNGSTQRQHSRGSSSAPLPSSQPCTALAWHLWSGTSQSQAPWASAKSFFFLFINQFNASLIILMECERKHLCPMTSTVSLGRKSSILVYLKKIQTRSNKLKGANRTLISFIPENSDLLLSAQLLP